jgi:FAD/FMN-containing dehydrogenase
LDKINLNTLIDNMSGSVITKGDTDYDNVRKIWNGYFDKCPTVIASCENAKDVIAAVNFARNNNYPLAVKGGGHNSAGTACVENGVMIDLSPMKKVTVDAENKTVRVQGGCLWSDVDKETQKAGLAVPCGIISHTGVGGLTLGGGFGWISRKYGLTVDNLLSAEVVTADGNIVRASKDENPDLFWAIRGGGGNFGVVTEFEFRCSEVSNEIYSGVLIKSVDDMK